MLGMAPAIPTRRAISGQESHSASANISSAKAPASAEPDDLTLAQGFKTCLDLYKRLLLAVGNVDSRVVALEQVDANRILDEYGRLKIWGEQTRASLSARVRGSLDDTLRHDGTLRDNVAEMFRQLRMHLELAIPLAEKTYDESLGSDQDSVSSLSSDSDYSSGSDTESEDDGDAPRPRRRVTKISVLMSHVFEQIQLLYNLASLLRRPGLTGRYLRSEKVRGSPSAMEFYDRCHVQEKLKEWSRQVKPENDGEYVQKPPEKDELEVTQEDISRRRESPTPRDIKHILSKRLAKANTRRREQLRYWSKHPCSHDSESVQKDWKEGHVLPRIDRPRGQEGVSAGGDETSTIKGLEKKNAKSLKSTPTALSFSTIARSAIFESETHAGRAKTLYAQSVVGGKVSCSTRVPDVPQISKTEKQFHCPYCFMTLNSDEMQDRLRWKRHVFRDLRPYSCTHPECTNQDKLFATRHDWTYHEMQMHRREYVCRDCNYVFKTKQLMSEHLHASHADSCAGSLTSRQLKILLDMSERPIDDIEIMLCPLCPSENPLKDLLHHLAEHMEEISLFVLGGRSDEVEDANSSAVVPSNADRESATRSNASAKSSLGYSNIDYNNRPSQTPQNFDQLKRSQSLDQRLKVSNWEEEVENDVISHEGPATDVSEVEEPISFVAGSRKERKDEPLPSDFNPNSAQDTEARYDAVHPPIPPLPQPTPQAQAQPQGQPRLQLHLVEDEEVSQERECGGSPQLKSLDDEPPSRGEIEQFPIIMGVDEHIPERRFVISSGPPSTSEGVEPKKKADPKPPREEKGPETSPYETSSSGRYASSSKPELTPEYRKPEDEDAYWSSKYSSRETDSPPVEEHPKGPRELRTPSGSSIPPGSQPWQPLSFDPDKDGAHLERFVDSVRRQSENSGATNVPKFPECRRKEPVAGMTDWLTLRLSDFNICPECYGSVIGNTEFRTFFLPMLRPSYRPIACDFGTSPWYRIAWLLTLKQNKPDLQLFYEVDHAIATTQNLPCPQDDTTSRNWFTIWDPYTRRSVNDFTVCLQCTKIIEALLPNLSNVFVPVDPLSEPTRGICSMRFKDKRKRFVMYFDAMETTSDLAHTEHEEPDIHMLAKELETMTLVSECHKDIPIGHGYWYTMQFLPKFTVCGDCFNEIVRPRLGDGNVIANNFYKQPERVSLATCQLYSPRMREVFQKACRTNDPKYLESKALERMDIEIGIRDKLKKLDGSNHDEEWIDQQQDKLIRDWKKWE